MEPVRYALQWIQIAQHVTLLNALHVLYLMFFNILPFGVQFVFKIQPIAQQ